MYIVHQAFQEKNFTPLLRLSTFFCQIDLTPSPTGLTLKFTVTPGFFFCIDPLKNPRVFLNICIPPEIFHWYPQQGDYTFFFWKKKNQRKWSKRCSGLSVCLTEHHYMIVHSFMRSVRTALFSDTENLFKYFACV